MSPQDLTGLPTSRSRRSRWVPAVGVFAVVVGLGAYVLAGTGSATAARQAAARQAQLVTSHDHSTRAVAAAPPSTQPLSTQPLSTQPLSTPPLAPNGTYTTPTGRTATIASLRGTPTMVWFVVGGCASCAASIPAVAAHFPELTSTGLRVLTLGLYGDFPPGKAGASAVLSFGRAAAGKAVERARWSWGMASKALSLAYDPSGVPDLYVLIGRGGHVRYMNTAPVSTMAKLLVQAKHLSTQATVALGT